MKILRVLNQLFIYVLCYVLFAGYWYQFSHHKEPCPLCLLQRLAMIGTAAALLMNLRFGIKIQHYGLAILSALGGRLVSLNQISLHGFSTSPIYGEAVLGYNLYVWAFIVFGCSIFASAILLIIQGFLKKAEKEITWNFFDKLALTLVFLLAIANTVTAFLDCGFTHCA